MTAALKAPLPAHDAWEAFIEQHEEGDEGAIEACARAAERDAIVAMLKREGAQAYLQRQTYRQVMLAELVGKIERGAHHRG